MRDTNPCHGGHIPRKRCQFEDHGFDNLGHQWNFLSKPFAILVLVWLPWRGICTSCKCELHNLSMVSFVYGVGVPQIWAKSFIEFKRFLWECFGLDMNASMSSPCELRNLFNSSVEAKKILKCRLQVLSPWWSLVMYYHTCYLPSCTAKHPFIYRRK